MVEIRPGVSLKMLYTKMLDVMDILTSLFQFHLSSVYSASVLLFVASHTREDSRLPFSKPRISLFVVDQRLQIHPISLHNLSINFQRRTIRWC